MCIYGSVLGRGKNRVVWFPNWGHQRIPLLCIRTRDEGSDKSTHFANFGAALDTTHPFSFFPQTLNAGLCFSGGKKLPEESRAGQTPVVSTHQTELVLRRPSVCQQFGPRVHFQNVSSCGAEVEKAIVVGHLGIREEKRPKGLCFPSDAHEPETGVGRTFSEAPGRPTKVLMTNFVWL